VTGSGEPLVLVHGGWSDRNNWLPVAPGLARSFSVVAYDRRNHGLSENGRPGSRHDQEDDLAALIEGIAGEPTNVVGTSFGGSIAIGLASRRPDLVRRLIVHEPPLVSVAADDPEAGPQLDAVKATVQAVLARVEGGDAAGAAEQFVEEVALGPGAWALLPQPLRQTMMGAAEAFAAEQRDPLWDHIDVGALRDIECPVLITQGDQSPAWFRLIVAKLAEATQHAEIHTYHGAGHAPHITHPDDYLAAVTESLTRLPVSRHQTAIAAR
jgi:pimeloyl-ACP methyl ester carboxylesterase